MSKEKMKQIKRFYKRYLNNDMGTRTVLNHNKILNDYVQQIKNKELIEFTTGKNFNFKKVVTLEEFKNLKDLKPGDTFVVTAKTKDSATGADKITKSIIEIDLQGNPQRIYNIA